MSKAYRPIPPMSELGKWFRYDPANGDLYRIAEINRRSLESQIVSPERKVGSGKIGGYLSCRVPGLSGSFSVSRIIWAMQTGVDPGDMQVDHINLDKQDNRWSNLRLATASQNSCNRKKPESLKGVAAFSLYKGVSQLKEKRGRGNTCISAQIRANGRSVRLGLFPTEQAAHAAYCEAAKKYHGEFARLE